MNDKKDSLDKIAEAQLRYTKTSKGKATQKKYIQSEQGKATLKKFQDSEKGKTIRDTYSKSEKGKLTHLKYYHSEKGKEKREERTNLRRLMSAFATYLETHPGTTVGDFLKEQNARRNED